MKIMFVCTGNTCRSPMAEFLFRKLIGDRDIEVSSAGLSAIKNSKANEYAINVGKLYGLDLTKHKSTKINDSYIDEMDLILCAETFHKNQLKKDYPYLKIYTIKEFAGEVNDIDLEDPYGGGLNAYLVCIKEIEKNLKIIINNKLI